MLYGKHMLALERSWRSIGHSVSGRDPPWHRWCPGAVLKRAEKCCWFAPGFLPSCWFGKPFGPGGPRGSGWSVGHRQSQRGASSLGTKREFSPERMKGPKPPHCRRSGLNVGFLVDCFRFTPESGPGAEGDNADSESGQECSFNSLQNHWILPTLISMIMCVAERGASRGVSSCVSFR
jgi:hypothetical protein